MHLMITDVDGRRTVKSPTCHASGPLRAAPHQDAPRSGP